MRKHFVSAGLMVALLLLVSGVVSAQANRYACPLQKPQKVYGYAINAKSVLEADETWTANNVYLIFGPLHIKGTLQSATPCP